VRSGAKKPRDVFEQQPAGPYRPNKFNKSEGKVATRSIHSRSLAGDGEILARGSSDKKVNWSVLASSFGEVFGIHVS
jgi:hypothetical protein